MIQAGERRSLMLRDIFAIIVWVHVLLAFTFLFGWLLDLINCLNKDSFFFSLCFSGGIATSIYFKILNNELFRKKHPWEKIE